MKFGPLAAPTYLYMVTVDVWGVKGRDPLTYHAASLALVVFWSPLDVIVLGSLATYLGEPWIARVRTTFAREALPDHAASCTLRAPSLDAIQDLSGLAAAVDVT